MWSDVIYESGPLVIGATAAALIAAYLWSRSRVASLFMVVWFGLAAAIGQVSFFEGPLTWAESHALGFAAFGTLSFAPAVVLLIAVFSWGCILDRGVPSGRTPWRDRSSFRAT